MDDREIAQNNRDAINKLINEFLQSCKQNSEIVQSANNKQAEIVQTSICAIRE